MRNAFAAELSSLAEKNKDICLLMGDIGNRLFNDFKANFMDRFLNCGVAEANMIGMAAGMALTGLRPIVYTITPFITTRCYEQIRVDLCYLHLPVILVGVGSGLCYASGGPTHHSCEDIAIMRVLPNMTVICPGDIHEVRAALNGALTRKGPVYIRLGKKNEPVVHKTPPDFKIGKGIVINKGRDVCLLSTGNILPLAIELAEKLNRNSISSQVVSMHTVKPMDYDVLSEIFSKFEVVATLEEHSILGGFGSCVSEWMTKENIQGVRLLNFGTSDIFMNVCGNQEFARQYFGLTSEKISKEIIKIFNEVG